MKRVTLIGLIALYCISVHAQKPRIMESLFMNSKILSQDVNYSIILPADYYTSGKRYPVVYLLHGLGDNESSWLEYGQVSQVADAAVKNKEIIPMIYVMPAGYRNYYVNDYAGKFLYEDMFIKEFVPFIDSQYRTLADKSHRATLGYSMGGFGTLVLPLRNPDVFTVSVPLSISVRTDSQYMSEDASGWDDQWGRLFGGVGATGENRLTDYYKQHSPFHIFAQADLSRLQNLKLYIDNGDDEETLCRSNEELHMLLRDRNFPHEFRVRNGGHEFQYWRDALPNGLHFISDAFERKPYRGDVRNLIKPSKVSKSIRLVDEGQYKIWLPSEYATTARQYPVLYVSGLQSQSLIDKIGNRVAQLIDNGSLTPLLIVFVASTASDIVTVSTSVEQKYRARNGWRFRALLGFESGGSQALSAALNPETFTSCILFDVPVDCEQLKAAVQANKKPLSRTWLFMYSPDKGNNYSANGCAHIFLRDQELYHEYRVQEGKGGEAWMLDNLDEALSFTQRKIHR
ncbi:MAG TPA: alpha/beta hydrolase-fold protein [Cyclobacteriaceae bacterium]|nr:alpha/beta hydrolase-fold protein [Cyclobacteriaceae bacterium]HNK81741.1 alpha/beta hydrolase-fold protein [Cyclobacteriaceae bacterium]